MPYSLEDVNSMTNEKCQGPLTNQVMTSDPLFVRLAAKHKISFKPDATDLIFSVRRKAFAGGAYIPGSARTLSTNVDVITKLKFSMKFIEKDLVADQITVKSWQSENAVKGGMKDLTIALGDDLVDTATQHLYSQVANAIVPITTLISDSVACGGVDPLATDGASAWHKAHVVRKWTAALTGTVAVTAASKALSGTATAFLTELRVGDTVNITDTDENYVVSAIASDSAATLVCAVTTTDASSAFTAYQETTYTSTQLIATSGGTTLIEKLISQAMDDVNIGNDSIDFIVAGKNIYRLLKDALSGKQQISGNEKLASLGFKQVAIEGTPVVLSKILDEDTALGINTKHMKLEFMKDRYFKLGELKETETLSDSYLQECKTAWVLGTNKRNSHFRLNTTP